MFVWDLPRRHLVFWWTRVFAVFFSISPTGKQHINTETSMGNFPVRESLCVCPTTPAGLLRDVSQKKKDSNRNLITFVFLSTANIMWGKRLNLVVFFSLLFILFYFLFNHLSFQIVVLEKEILQAESKPGKFPPPPPSGRLGLFLWCSVMLIDFADGLSPQWPTMLTASALIQKWQLHFSWPSGPGKMSRGQNY